MSVNFMMGVISHLPDDLSRCEERCRIHKQQLDWVGKLQNDFRSSISETFKFYQVEGAWGETARSICTAEFPVEHIETGRNYPGKNRNFLLDVLYKSDYDWLVCMDDDRRFYPMFNADTVFKDLSTPCFIELAKHGYMILCVDPMVAPFKKTNYAFPQKETHWFMAKGNPNGFLQICFIPNLVKYGYKPIYFNGDTACTLNAAPEDVQFQLDWLIAKHPIIRNNNLIMDEIGQSNGNKSVIFPSVEYRRECEASHNEWVTAYLKSRLPRNPDMWTKAGLNKKRNPVFNAPVPRGEYYEFTGRDLPKEH